MLRLGKMTTQELAEWMGIKYPTFRKNAEKRYEILAQYCTYNKVYGGVEILDIMEPEYKGDLTKNDVKNYLEEIKSIENRLSSVAGMQRKFQETKPEYKDLKSSTVYYRLQQASNIAFGKNNTIKATHPSGAYGSRKLVWAIKVSDYNEYRYMTKEEEKILDTIISTYCNKNPDKIKAAALLEEEYKEDADMSKEEYFLKKEALGLDVFGECIKLFYQKTNLVVVHCSEHTLKSDTAF